LLNSHCCMRMKGCWLGRVLSSLRSYSNAKHEAKLMLWTRAIDHGRLEG
jgi:hypothetical protein